jgi:aryl-phospho-beta-D-glucosidase BglC (GH1 family)
VRVRQGASSRPRPGWRPSTRVEARTILNDYNLAAVNAIRATGGNNAVRHIMVPTHAAIPSTTCIDDLEIPNNDPRIIVSLHTYYPNEFSFGSETYWGSSSDVAAMEVELDRGGSSAAAPAQTNAFHICPPAGLPPRAM